MVKCGIYKITNTINNKVYIGQSKNIYARISAHKRNECNKHLKNAYVKYGIDSFLFDIIEELPDIQELLNISECFYINMYQSINPMFGYNKKEGGFSGRHTEETKRKIGELNKKRGPASAATRERLSKANSGHVFYGKRKQSKETIEKMRESQKKRRNNETITDEFRNKISEINKGRRLSYEQKEGIRRNMIGTKASQEKRDKMRKAQQERRKQEKIRAGRF